MKKVHWSIEEVELLKKLWVTDISNKELTSNFENKTYSNLETKATRSLNLLPRTTYVKSESITWTDEETSLLLSMWNTTIEYSVIFKSIPNKTRGSIISKSKRLGLPKRPDEVRKRSAAIKNKAMGRDLSPENLKLIASKYTSKSEFRREDLSAYGAAQRLGIFDDICSHMTTGVAFNYPQTALFEITKLLFPSKTIRYNDRKEIYPKELDIFIVEDRIAFEYDGKNFHCSEEDIKRDDEKDNICINNNIKLYRILEINKQNPIPEIIKQLTNYGFDTSKIDINYIKSHLTKYYMDINKIKDIISKYTSSTQFIKENPTIYSFLKKNNLMGLLSEILPKPVTEEHIIDKIKMCNNKLEFIKNHSPLYGRIMQNKDIFPLAIEEYNKLQSNRPTKTH